ncbi:MAG: DoxX family protein [Nitrospirae bacterium]|nr:DoxX family protein [Nitrospirota bacterium]
MFRRFFSTENDISLFFMRLLLGLVILPHGAQKLIGLFDGLGYYATIAFFTGKMGLPYWVAVLVITGESLGSIFLIIGFMTRLAALGTLCIMTGCIYLIHLENGFFMNWSGKQSGEGFEYHLLAIAIALALMIKGGGKWSIDLSLSGGKSKK